jgi:FtsZ-binding cell division protein ZapB
LRSDIPEDIKQAAYDCARGIYLNVDDAGAPYLTTDDIEEIAKAILAERNSLTAERERLREENERLEAARAEQWRQRRDAEGSRDAARAAADSLRMERDALREAMEGIVHFSDALNFRNDQLSKALSQWIEAGRALLSQATEGKEP